MAVNGQDGDFEGGGSQAVIPGNPFNWWINGEAMQAYERRRREALGRWGRFREDATAILAMAVIIASVVSVTFVPWIVGARTILTWLVAGE